MSKKSFQNIPIVNSDDFGIRGDLEGALFAILSETFFPQTVQAAFSL